MQQQAIELCQQLMRCESVTPNDAGCQEIIKNFLQSLSFEFINLDKNGVSNLLAIYNPKPEQPLLLYVGHTDVVPTGDLNSWSHPPFAATIVNEELHGRGAADMKSSIAAILVAIKQAIETNTLNINIALAITSDEEGPAKCGCKHIAEYMQEQNIIANYCLVGEPSSTDMIGDTIKIGRRGSLHAELTFRGKQGHIAYPQLADNPIHKAAAPLDALAKHQWDNGNSEFPATSMQISNINAGCGAANVIPEILIANINFRFSPASTVDSLQREMINIIDNFTTDYTINWQTSAQPFYSAEGKLRQAITTAIEKECGFTPEYSTAGGTSDGRFFANDTIEIVELGVCNKTIHQIDEHIKLEELTKLAGIYYQCLIKL